MSSLPQNSKWPIIKWKITKIFLWVFHHLVSGFSRLGMWLRPCFPYLFSISFSSLLLMEKWKNRFKGKQIGNMVEAMFPSLISILTVLQTLWNLQMFLEISPNCQKRFGKVWGFKTSRNINGNPWIGNRNHFWATKQ